MKKGVYLVLFLSILFILNINLILSLSCSETDSGIDYYNKGVLKINKRTYTDSCKFFSNTLYEYYCEGDNYYKLSYSCPFGCKSGACKTNPNAGCFDSDGLNYFAKGKTTLNFPYEIKEKVDECRWGRGILPLVREYICENDTTIGFKDEICKDGCFDGKCLTSSGFAIPDSKWCRDSDKGINFYESGDVWEKQMDYYLGIDKRYYTEYCNASYSRAFWDCYTDYCVRGDLYEAYCDYNKLTLQTTGKWIKAPEGLGHFLYRCPAGCSDGKCNVCVPNCDVKECGDDGCYGSCGECSGEKKDCSEEGKCIKISNKGSCVDSDVSENYPDGLDYYKFGNISIVYAYTGKTYAYNDTCAGVNDRLYENFCINGSNGVKNYKCPYGCKDGVCIKNNSCISNCTGKVCGDDSCGGVCGTCSTGKTCSNGLCVNITSNCTPQCAGKTCGDNGCSGSCGTCATGKVCSNGQCVGSCTPNCADKECGNLDDGCGGKCSGTCTVDKFCDNGKCLKCKDTDVDSSHPDGNNSLVKGTVISTTTNYTDLCYQLSKSDPTKLDKIMEYYCNSNNDPRGNWIFCPNGCDDGACLNNPVVTGKVIFDESNEQGIIIKFINFIKNVFS